jgi:co-chaperonin GroES (HSP10)
MGSLELVGEIKQDTDFRAIGKIISIGNPLKGDVKLNIQKGDSIVTDIRYVEKYEIFGKDYWVVRQKYLFGKS